MVPRVVRAVTDHHRACMYSRKPYRSAEGGLPSQRRTAALKHENVCSMMNQTNVSLLSLRAEKLEASLKRYISSVKTGTWKMRSSSGARSHGSA
eukprot:4572859-Prymnesium_polylepis.1